LVLPKELARNLSDISALVLVKAVAKGVHVVDPLTGEVRFMILAVLYSHSGFEYR
jgi:hypothetical protein